MHHDAMASIYQCRCRFASLFRNGRSWTLRIPREFELPGDASVIRKEGNCLIIAPVTKRPLLEEDSGLFASSLKRHGIPPRTVFAIDVVISNAQ
jgi:virulence-associated protein VagC